MFANIVQMFKVITSNFSCIETLVNRMLKAGYKFYMDDIFFIR